MIITDQDAMVERAFESECAEQIKHMTNVEKAIALQQYKDEYIAKQEAERAASLAALPPHLRFRAKHAVIMA
jgi:hypothetical protein